jgi:glycosyltransferase involved in cell wall biosynthesis
LKRRGDLEVSVAVAIPCYNEERTIGKVVSDFRQALPDSRILVFDNVSTDGSFDAARNAGADVFREERRGKGYVVQNIFRTVDADICVLVDGDDTYPAEDVHSLLAPLLDGEADMVVGNRLEDASGKSLARVRRLGNLVFLGLVNVLTRQSFQDVLCGFRAVNRRFLDSVTPASGAFEIETELTLRAVSAGMRIREVRIGYRPRPEGSYSKLHPFKDGCRILLMIAKLLVQSRISHARPVRPLPRGPGSGW